jgi:adenylate cyclase
MALAHLVAQRFSDVLRLTEWAIEHPMFPPAYRFRAAALAQLGRTDEAAALIRQLLKIQPNATVSRTTRLAWNPAATAILVDGLRKAGLPE